MDSVIAATAGMVGGMVSFATTYPLLTIATRKQVHKEKEKQHRGESPDLQHHHWIKENAVSAGLHIVRTEGWTQLYAGLKTGVVGVAVQSFIYYLFYTALREATFRYRRRRSQKQVVSLGLATDFLVASLAGAMTTTCTSPIWVVMTRMQAKKKKKAPAIVVSGCTKKGRPGLDVCREERDGNDNNNVEGRTQDPSQPADSLRGSQDPNVSRTMMMQSMNPSGAFTELAASSSSPHRTITVTDDGEQLDPTSPSYIIREVLQRDGWRGFWRGWLMSLVLVTNPAIQYMVFERMRQIVLKSQKRPANGALGMASTFLLGAISKLVTTIVTYPIIVVKSRMQVSSSKREALESVFAALLQEGGIIAFYRGLSSKILQTVLASALMFALQAKIHSNLRKILQIE